MADSFSSDSFSATSFTIYDIGDAGGTPVPARSRRRG